MSTPIPQTIPVSDEAGAVGGLLLRPPEARALYVFGHGAGAGMNHPFMRAASEALYERGVATLRYEFPYMAAGRRRPDVPRKLVATVRAALDAARAIDDLPLFAGGKSMGGRMTSTALSDRDEPAVRGLVFYGFPLHAPAKPGAERGQHLRDTRPDLLFLQGTRDRLARLELLEPLLEHIGPRATLHVVHDADHGFGVPKRAGRSAAEIHAELADRTAAWCLDRV